MVRQGVCIYAATSTNTPFSTSTTLPPTLQEAVSRGDVDEANKPIVAGDKTSKKKKKKLTEDQSKNATGGNGGALRMGADGLLESRVSSDVGLLSSLVISHADVAARYNENVAVLTNEIMPELNELCKTLAESVEKIEGVGDALVFECEAAENKVQEAWLQYEDAAGRALNGSNAQIGVPVVANDQTLVENSYDVWLFEMK